MNFISGLVLSLSFTILAHAEEPIALNCRIYETQTRYTDYHDSYSSWSGWICQKRACALARRLGVYVGYNASSLDSKYYFYNNGTCNSNGTPETDSVSGSLPGLN